MNDLRLFAAARASWAVRLAAPLLFLGLASACAVTEEDIVRWETTQRGPGRIVAVLMADKYDDGLRIRAGVALVEMEPRTGDHAINGLDELQHALEQLPEETRARIVDGMAPQLIAIMRGEGAGAAPADADTVPPIQIRAKDASYLIIGWGSPETRSALTDGIVGWFVEDFNGRNLAGTYSAEQVVRALGAPAASRLVDAMTARIPQAALVQIANLIAQIGDDATKARAAERVVAVETEMEGAEFGAWLTERYRSQLTERGITRSDAEISVGVEANRELYITEGALPAMHHLAGQAVVVNRLLAIAQVATPTAPTTAAALETRRVTALQAMEGHVRGDQVAALLAIALATTNSDRIRDYAFDRIADSHDRSVLPQLWPLATQDGTARRDAWRERWRVGSLLLTLGGPDVVVEWFTRLPAIRDVRYAREELHGYAERLAQMRPEPTSTVRAQLTSPDWWDQAIALYYFERTGTEADLPAIQRLASSATATAGEHWEEHDTIGKIATDAIEAIRERASSASAAAAPDAGTAPAPAPGPAAPPAP
jgi:hypothetical protein